MVHGDDNGLVLPPDIAPIQTVIIPIAMHKGNVLEEANKLKDRLAKIGLRIRLDETEQTPGWKFAEYEMKGVPLRIEIGPRDIENNTCVLVRRDNGEKITSDLSALEKNVEKALNDIRADMYKKALERRDSMIYTAASEEELKEIVSTKSGFIKMMWCGDERCEKQIKEEYGVGSRCIPFEQEHINDKCVCCGKEAKYMVYWGKAY